MISLLVCLFLLKNLQYIIINSPLFDQLQLFLKLMERTPVTFCDYNFFVNQNGDQDLMFNLISEIFSFLFYVLNMVCF